jgi:hypothetical protein
VLPFGTSLMATYLRQGQGQGLAAAVYAGLLLLMSVAFSTLNRHILFRKPHMLDTELTEERRRQILRRAQTGLIPYVVGAGGAPLSADLTLIICASMAIFYALPLASGGADPA